MANKVIGLVCQFAFVQWIAMFIAWLNVDSYFAADVIAARHNGHVARIVKLVG